MCAEIQLATSATIRACCAGPVCWRLTLECRLIFKRPTWASVYASAATNAGACAEGCSGIRDNPRIVTAIKYLPHKLPLNFFADPYTAVASNAFGHVDVNVRMRVVNEVWFIRSVEITFAQTISQRLVVKGLVS